MRSGLKDGVLIPPRSLPRAVARLERMERELERMWRYLDSISGGAVTVTEKQQRAHDAISLFTEERRQLADWIRARELELFEETYRWMKALYDDGSLDFTSDELQLLKRLDELFAAKRPQSTKPERKVTMPPKKDEEKEAQFQIVGDIATARELAKRIFGDRATVAVVFRVFDELPIEEEDVEKFEQTLKTCQEIAADQFGTAAATDPEAVLGIYERVFAEVDEEGEEE